MAGQSIPEGKSIYFVSDIHLGAPDAATSRDRERKFVAWLDQIAADAHALYIVGDLFDFWFEYKRAVPKGFVRTLGKLAELREKGILIYFFVGNHDMWMSGYFEEELDIPVFHEPIMHHWNEIGFYIGHGDGLGPGDGGYKFLKRIFRHPVCKWLFGKLHPDFGIWIANAWSSRSRTHTTEEQWLGDKDEWLAIYAEKMSSLTDATYFVFGHRHLTIDLLLSDQESRYINLGEWFNTRSYAVFDGTNLSVEFYNNPNAQIHP